MKLAVHTSGLRFVAGGPGEPDVHDDEQRTDADGKPLMNVPVVVAGASRAPPGDPRARRRIRSPGEAHRVPAITVKDLSVRYWESNGRSGLSFSADAIAAA